MTHLIPSKLLGYLKRLKHEYDLTGKSPEREIIASAKYRLIENTQRDGEYNEDVGHTLIIYVPEETMKTIRIQMQEVISNSILKNLNQLARPISHEYFHQVSIEIEDTDDPNWQAAKSLSTRFVEPDQLSFWERGNLRLFISHRDSHKKFAQELRDHFKKVGISAFVAHETIEANKKWPEEIEKALHTMQVALALITDDFDRSPWCHQEIGFALGTGVPIVSVKLSKESPKGFISSKQAVRGNITDARSTFENVLPYIATESGTQEAVDDLIINNFLNSGDFMETIDNFKLMSKVISKISTLQASKIIDGYGKNDQIYNCGYLMNERAFLTFFNRVTGKQFEVYANKIIPDLFG